MKQGKLEKMTIRAFTDPRCLFQIAEPFEFDINPESFTYKYAIEQSANEAPGNTNQIPTYFNHAPNIFDFRIIIDGTGALRNDSGTIENFLFENDRSLYVKYKVQKLKLFTLEYNGDTHRNNYIIISWGTMVFKGSLESLDLNYKLFDADGSPLRVEANLKLREWLHPELQILIDNASSPDITHERIFKAGDKFSLMSERIYNDSKYYIDVAKANKLNSFRKISFGTELIFPPIIEF